MEKNYFEWDTIIWGKSLGPWREILNSKNSKHAIDLGARRGGMSLFLAKEFSIEVICSDLENPKLIAEKLHSKYNCEHLIEYRAIDCTKIDLPSNSIDIVILKSLLGDLRTFENQETAIFEIFRILKPGGIFLFAENLEASPMHMLFRKKFTKWASFWRYIKYTEMDNWLNIFSRKTIETNGFLTTFLPYKYRDKFAPIDRLILPFVPKKWRYVCYGYAVK